MNTAPRSKTAYLDSLRGLAAMTVVAAHFAGAFYPRAVLGEGVSGHVFPEHGFAEPWFHWPPLATAVSGRFAVTLFFVLSGFVLSIGVISRRRAGSAIGDERTAVWRSVLKRPIRLGGLVVVSMAIGYGLWSADAYRNTEVTAAVGSQGWFDKFWRDTPSLAEFASHVTLNPFHEGERYNPPLWTIERELIGSYLVFGYLFLSRRLGPRGRAALLAAMGAAFLTKSYLAFVIGIALAELTAHRSACRGSGETAKDRGQTLGIGAIGVAVVGFLVGGLPSVASLGVPVAWAPSLDTLGKFTCPTIGATLLLAATLRSDAIQRILDRPSLRYLGHVSYAVYVLHFLVQGAVACAVYLATVPTLGHSGAFLAAVAATFAVLMPLAHLLTTTVDAWSIRASAAFADAVLSRFRRLRGRDCEVERDPQRDVPPASEPPPQRRAA